MVRDRAFWFRSGAEEYKIISLAKGETHIQKVIDNPAIFGEVDKIISETYRKYDETSGWEGKARGEILSRLKRRGWLRSRFYKSQSRWIIDIDEIHIFDDKEFYEIVKGRDEISIFMNTIILRTNK